MLEKFRANVLKCPHPGEFTHFQKKNANARWLARGGGEWALLELTDALLQNMNNCLQIFEGEPRKVLFV